MSDPGGVSIELDAGPGAVSIEIDDMSGPEDVPIGLDQPGPDQQVPIELDERPILGLGPMELDVRPGQSASMGLRGGPGQSASMKLHGRSGPAIDGTIGLDSGLGAVVMIELENKPGPTVPIELDEKSGLELAGKPGSAVPIELDDKPGPGASNEKPGLGAFSIELAGNGPAVPIEFDDKPGLGDVSLDDNRVDLPRRTISSQLCGFVQFFRFEMKECQQRILQTNAIFIFVDECLRGAGQMALQNNPVCGLFILAAYYQYTLGGALLATIGTIFGTLTSYVFGDVGRRRAGLYGFGGFLIGAMVNYPFFHTNPTSTGVTLPFELFLIVPVLAAASSFAMHAGCNSLGRHFQLPVLGLPAVCCANMWILGCQGGQFAFFPLDRSRLEPVLLRNYAAFDQPPPPYDAGVLVGLINNISNVVLLSDPITGICVLLGLLCASPIEAGLAVLASVISFVLQLALGAQQELIVTGLRGFNPVLVALSMGLFVVLRGWRAWVFVVSAIVFTFFLSAGLSNAASVIGITMSGIPFTIMTWLMLLAGKGVPGLTLVPLGLVSVPEEHLKLPIESLSA